MILLTKNRKAILLSTITNNIARILGWTTSIYVSVSIIKHLGEGEFARFAVVLSFAGLGSILDLGAGTSFAEFSGKKAPNDGDTFQGQLLGHAWGRLTSSLLLFFAITTVALLVSKRCLPQAIDYKVAASAFACFMITGISQYAALAQRLYAIQLKDYKSNLIAVLANIVSALLVANLVKWKAFSGEYLAVGMTCLSATILIGATFIGLKNNILPQTKSEPNRDESSSEDLKRAFNLFGYKITLITISGIIGGALDTVLVCRFISLEDAARHSLGYRIFLGVALAQLSINQLWPIVSKKWASGGKHEQRRVIRMLYAASLAVGLSVSAIAVFSVTKGQELLNLKWATFSSSELLAFSILSTSAGLGGISMLLCGRESMLTGIVALNIGFCLISLPVKYWMSLRGGLAGFLWGAALARIFAYDIPVFLFLRSKMQRI